MAATLGFEMEPKPKRGGAELDVSMEGCGDLESPRVGVKVVV